MNKKLNPIAEIDESELDNATYQRHLGHLPLNLIQNYDSLMDLKIKEKIKSLGNLHITK
jgi:hypothetical protein